MFTNIKVSNIRGLTECTLLNLGKINVICGKNNSGKSTLLEGINGGHKGSGKRFKDEDVAQVYEATVNAMGFNRTNTTLSGLYSNLLKTVLMTDRIWFSNEEETFVKSIEENYRQDGQLRSYALGSGALTNVYTSLFPEHTTETILLPAKRQLELIVTVNSAEVPSSQGKGVLNYLFYARSQLETSEDRKVYEKISTAFTAISSGYKFDILLDRQNILTLRFAYKNHPWRIAQDCGLGLQDLLIILTFALYLQYPVILIEEPESHIHPDMQRKLLSFLREETVKQFFMTTHSNVFLNNTLVDKVFFTHFNDTIEVDDATSRAAILNDLGYAITDNLVSDLIILVEGPKDTPVIEEFLVKFGLFGQYDIKIWPLGGDIMDQVDLSVFAQNYSIIALVDHDPGSSVIRERFISNCQKYCIPVHRLERYSIENYFSVRVLQEVFKGQIPETLTHVDFDTKLEDQINMNVKNNVRKIVSRMNLAEIENTDLYEFFEKIKLIIQEREITAG